MRSYAEPPVRQPGALLLYVIAGTLSFTVVVGFGTALFAGDSAGDPLSATLQYFSGKQAWDMKRTVIAGALVAVLSTALVVGYTTWSARRRTTAPMRAIKHAASLIGDGRELAPSLIPPDRADEIADTPGWDLGDSLTTQATVVADGRMTGLLVSGPGGGKSTAFAVPLILAGCFPFRGKSPNPHKVGNIVATSNKPDIWKLTHKIRAKFGTVWVFDPQKIAHRKPTWWWDYASYVVDEVKAQALARLFAASTSDSSAKRDPYFDEEGPNLLADLLLAGACGGRPITQIFGWLTNRRSTEAADILEEHGYGMSAEHLLAMYHLPDEQRGGVFGVAIKSVQFLNNREALAWITPQGDNDPRPKFNPEKFVRATSDTLISMSREGTGSFGPLTAAITVAVTEAAEKYAEECGGHLPNSLGAILDEAANTVRWDQLPAQYSHYGSRGIFLFTIIQNWAQGVRAWSEHGMQQMWDAASVKIVGPGSDDAQWLGHLSTLIGNYHAQRRSLSSGSSKSGGGSISTSYDPRPVLDVSALRALPPWTNVVLSSGSEAFILKSIPYWNRGKEMASAVADSKRAVK